MSKNTITGRAKKFDGTAIDYVSIFNWSDGKCIAQVTPDIAGNWSYTYLNASNVGLTYVAYGCEPVTHGPYQFEYIADIPIDFILAYDFNGSYLDKSANSLHGVGSGNVRFVEGRKAEKQALEFIDGCIQTPNILPINGNKVTISFWVKSPKDNEGIVMELGANDVPSGFSSYLSKTTARADLFLNNKNSNNTLFQSIAYPVVDGWTHIVFELNKVAGLSEKEYQKIYVNNVDVTTHGDNKTKESANFITDKLYIGKRGGSSLPVSLVLQDVRIYNRILTDIERSALFNE